MMDINQIGLNQIDNYISDEAVSLLTKKLESALTRTGIYYRLFGRKKTAPSIKEKIIRKGYPTKTGGVMQDIIGLRIALYYADDVEICKSIIQNTFEVVNISATGFNEDVFRPEVLNLVCRMPEDVKANISELVWELPIDSTFEVQIRTVFSEGWHEIEHDVRFKSNVDWASNKDLSRNLNGIFATLETCDWAILQLLNDLAYREYKNAHWASMLRMKYRIHFSDVELSKEIVDIFNNNPEIAKSFFRVDRNQIIYYLGCIQKRLVPLKIDTIVFMVNKLWIKNPEILSITPGVMDTLLTPLQ